MYSVPINIICYCNLVAGYNQRVIIFYLPLIISYKIPITNNTINSV